MNRVRFSVSVRDVFGDYIISIVRLDVNFDIGLDVSSKVIGIFNIFDLKDII